MELVGQPYSLQPTASRLLLLRLHHRPALVRAAVRADDVRRLRCAALRARLQLLGLHPVVRATLTGAGIGMFAFGDGHGLSFRSGQGAHSAPCVQ
jgi:hypothetical protein